MEQVKRMVMVSVLLLIFVVGCNMLLKQFRLYKRAFDELEKLISHPSIEVQSGYAEDG